MVKERRGPILRRFAYGDYRCEEARLQCTQVPGHAPDHQIGCRKVVSGAFPPDQSCVRGKNKVYQRFFSGA